MPLVELKVLSGDEGQKFILHVDKNKKMEVNHTGESVFRRLTLDERTQITYHDSIFNQSRKRGCLSIFVYSKYNCMSTV